MDEKFWRKKGKENFFGMFGWVGRKENGRVSSILFSISFDFPFLLLFLNFPFTLVIDIQNKQQLNRWSSCKCSKCFFLDLSIILFFYCFPNFPFTLDLVVMD